MLAMQNAPQQLERPAKNISAILLTGGKKTQYTRTEVEIKTQKTIIWLVVEPTHLKNISQNGSSSPGRDENKKYVKPPR